jgi:hypothetical protein
MKALVIRCCGWMIYLASAASTAQPVHGGGTRVAWTDFSTAEPDQKVEIVREIDDPATGDRWLLEKSPQNPGGPGRMVLSENRMAAPVPAGSSAAAANGAPEVDARAVLIRNGERLIVEEHTQILDATLEGIALAPARMGKTLLVRLAIGGRVVKAIAITPGRALLVPYAGARP